MMPTLSVWDELEPGGWSKGSKLELSLIESIAPEARPG